MFPNADAAFVAGIALGFLACLGTWAAFDSSRPSKQRISVVAIPEPVTSKLEKLQQTYDAASAKAVEARDKEASAIAARQQAEASKFEAVQANKVMQDARDEFFHTMGQLYQTLPVPPPVGGISAIEIELPDQHAE